MITYTYDVPIDAASVAAGREHVVAHLSAVASADDDPATNADDVVVQVGPHPEQKGMARIVGTLDAEPAAPYLDGDHDPLTGVDPDLFAAEVAAAQRDEEVLRGQA